MKNIITVSLLVLLLLVGCTGVARNTQSEPAGSQMVPEDFIMQGELKEISDNRLLIDLENQGLTWVSVQDDSDLNISIHSLVSIQIIGGIMESYPGQASGHSVVVVTPFIENSLYTYDEMVSLMASGDKYPLVVWNGPKDMVAYAERMPVDEGYEVYVASLYESSPWRLALVYGTLPDLNWFYDRLEVQTSDGAMEFGPDFVQAEPYVFGEPKATEPTAQPDEGSFYELSPEIYEDQDHKIQIQYVLVEGMKGELVQDYVNQSLKAIVDIFSQGYEDLTLDYKILQQDDLLTVEYSGKNNSMGYEISRVLCLHMPTATELTIDNTVADKEAFERLFMEKSGYELSMLEGVRIYVAEGQLTATFVPTDDSSERQYVNFNLLEYQDLFRFDYEMPAS